MGGNLTINGITKPVVLYSSIEPQSGPGGAGAQELVAKLRISRSQFGMTGFSLLVGDEVDIEIDSVLLPAR
jgi:polyisoprenoid-binding protein YceI